MSTSRGATKLTAELARQRALNECLAIALLQARASGGSKDWAACAEHIAAQIEALGGALDSPAPNGAAALREALAIARSSYN